MLSMDTLTEVSHHGYIVEFRRIVEVKRHRDPYIDADPAESKDVLEPASSDKDIPGESTSDPAEIASRMRSTNSAFFPECET